jgi:DNA-binding transcriptional LysR family regulator
MGDLMEFHQLQYVVAVASHRHFTKAAEAICVAQSSLSQQITKLEDELGLKLFDRTTRTVYPTCAGHEFILHAKRIIAQVEAAKQSMEAYANLTKGTVNIGAITTLESIDFVALISAFHRTYSGLHINIVNTGSYRLAELLQTMEINAAIFSPQVDTDLTNLDIYPLAEDEFVLVTSLAHPLANHQAIDLAELAAEDFIFPSPDQSIYKIYEKACRDAGFSPRIVCQSSHSESSLALVANGMGIGFFPRDTIVANMPPGVSIIHLANPIKKHIALALLKRPHYPPPVAAFRDFVLNWINR